MVCRTTRGEEGTPSPQECGPVTMFCSGRECLAWRWRRRSTGGWRPSSPASSVAWRRNMAGWRTACSPRMTCSAAMNSVGHMARFKAEELLRRNATLAEELKDVPRERLVYWALPTAMRTIGAAVEGSTRGTWLGERGRFPEDKDPPSYEVRERVFRDL